MWQNRHFFIPVIIEDCPCGLPSAEKKTQASEKLTLWECALGAVCPAKVYLTPSLDKEWMELREQELDVPNSSPGVRVPADRCGEVEPCHTYSLSWLRPSLLVTAEVMP